MYLDLLWRTIWHHTHETRDNKTAQKNFYTNSEITPIGLDILWFGWSSLSLFEYFVCRPVVVRWVQKCFWRLYRTQVVRQLRGQGMLCYIYVQYLAVLLHSKVNASHHAFNRLCTDCNMCSFSVCIMFVWQS